MTDVHLIISNVISSYNSVNNDLGLAEQIPVTWKQRASGGAGQVERFEPC